MAEMVLERDQVLEEQKRLRHERFNALVSGDRYEERSRRAFGTPVVEEKETPSYDRNYVANRVKNASDVAKGAYTIERTAFPQDYTQPAPDWSYAQNLPQEETYYTEEEETEDQRPTLTTTQYMSVSKAKSLSAAETADEYFSLSASARVVIAVLVTVVLAIAALIWVNASVIASLSVETAALESQIASLASQLSSVDAQIVEATSKEVITAFAENIGMILG